MGGSSGGGAGADSFRGGNPYLSTNRSATSGTGGEADSHGYAPAKGGTSSVGPTSDIAGYATPAAPGHSAAGMPAGPAGPGGGTIPAHFNAAQGGAGATGGTPVGPMPVGGGAGGGGAGADEDYSSQRFLVETDDAFGDGQLVSPAVIGENEDTDENEG